MNLRTFGDAFSTAPYIVKYHDMNRETFIARLTEVQQIVEQLLAQVQASEHDAFDQRNQVFLTHHTQMKVFISWSGKLSGDVAALLSTWLKDVLQGTKTWLSNSDIDKGSIWFGDITEQLAETKVGILCLTQDNKNAPWILFEAGALSKGAARSRVCPLLIDDLQPSELEAPLSEFNSTFTHKDDIFKLVRTVNAERSEPLTEAQLSRTFELWWPEFQKLFKEILTKNKTEGQAEKRSTDSMIEEGYSSYPDPFNVPCKNHAHRLQGWV